VLEEVEAKVTLNASQRLKEQVEGLLTIACASALEVEEAGMHEGARGLFDETLIDEPEVVTKGVKLGFAYHGFGGVE
jgi:hypothetical protein